MAAMCALDWRSRREGERQKTVTMVQEGKRDVA